MVFKQRGKIVFSLNVIFTLRGFIMTDINKINLPKDFFVIGICLLSVGITTVYPEKIYTHQEFILNTDDINRSKFILFNIPYLQFGKTNLDLDGIDTMCQTYIHNKNITYEIHHENKIYYPNKYQFPSLSHNDKLNVKLIKTAEVKNCKLKLSFLQLYTDPLKGIFLRFFPTFIALFFLGKLFIYSIKIGIRKIKLKHKS